MNSEGESRGPSSREGRPLVAVGRVVGCHGLRGELRVRLFNPESRILTRTSRVYLSAGGAGPRVERVRGARPHQSGWLLSLEEIPTRDAAEALSGTEVLVVEEDLAPLGRGEYYQYQLMGLEVLDESGHALGSVRQVMNTGGSDILVVDDRGRERLIPMIEDVVRTVDLKARRIVIRPLPGLLDL